MIWVGKDPKDHPVPTACHGHRHLPLEQREEEGVEKRPPVGRLVWYSVTGKVVLSSPGSTGSHRNGKIQGGKGETNTHFKQMKKLQQISLHLSNSMPRYFPSCTPLSVLHKHSYTFFPKIFPIIANVQNNTMKLL